MATLASTMPIRGQEYKLKDLKSLDLKPGEKLAVDVEGIDEAKVLLVNTGGKVTALGAKCTHYGAPLVKGVLTGDGRLTCPWHGGKYTNIFLGN
jgi:nitrite reductase/ring-hydroxylating ferredoxin subunit